MKDDKTIVMKPVEMGGGGNFKQRRLDTYKKLPMDPTMRYKKELVMILDKATANGIINEKEYAFLNIKNPQIPDIYHLSFPGRPIVSGIKPRFCLH